MSELVYKPDIDPPGRLWRLTSWLLYHTAARANRVVTRHLGSAAGRTRYAILAALDQFGAISQAELGRRLGIDRSDLVAAINDMESDDLVKRMPDPQDRRRNAIHLTPAGSDLLLEYDILVDVAQDEVLQKLSPEERGQLGVLLRRLLA
jgi:DNA-binding MarR family transcriptional regulator